MRTKVTPASPEVALTRLLEALGQELIDASDEEIIAAAKDLGMDPHMKGSAAFFGLKYPAKPQLADFLEFEVCRKVQAAKVQAAAERITGSASAEPKAKVRRSRRPKAASERKDPADE